MSRLNGKHLARVNQQLSGQPSQAPYGCAQLAGAVFPAELEENPAAPIHEPSPWFAAVSNHFMGRGRTLPPFLAALVGELGQNDRAQSPQVPTTGVCKFLMSVWQIVVFFHKSEGL